MPEEKDLLINEFGVPQHELTYTSPDKKYFFQFSHLEKGVFMVTSKGYTDDNSIKMQMQVGDKIRLALSTKYPNTPFHLIWDISEVRGASIRARYTMMRHAASLGKFSSISAIGANNLAKSYIKIISSLMPHLKFFFYNTVNEAISATLKRSEHSDYIDTTNCRISNETDTYATFIDLWQQTPEYCTIGTQKLKTLQLKSWRYISSENNFKVHFSLLEGYIITIRCEGFIKTQNIDNTYRILEAIMSEFGYVNSGNKFYTILDLKKVKGISLNARKQTNYYEDLYKDRAHLVIMLPSPILHLALRIQKKINLGSFNHWIECSSIADALEIIYKHKKGLFSIDNLSETDCENNFTIPENKEDLILLVKKLHIENRKLLNNQKEHIQRILEITGRMTWDETFSENLEIHPDDSGPFSDVYNALSVVHTDFKEIIKDKFVQAQKLRESEDKYWNLINLASDIIAVFQNGKCKLINSRVLDVMGYTPEEAKHISPKDFLPSGEYERVMKKVESIKVNATAYLETRIYHKTRKEIPVSVSVGAITFENKPARIYIVRDITAKKIAEAELERYRNQLETMVAERTTQLEKEITERKLAEKSDRLKSAFLSNMSHEIRTPMNAIIAFSNFLRNSEISQQQREEYINYIQSSGESLLNLINDIIDISKIEAKQINIQRKNCAINPILEELFTLFENTRKNKGCNGLKINLVKNTDHSDLIINTDPYRLKQILSNLLHNSLKFTENGLIEFGYKTKNKSLEFYVKDTGIGIPPDKIDYIFQRFGKLESGKNKRGTGLGLAISQNLAKLLDGKLTVESTFGKGSTFFLTIPFTKDQQYLETNTQDNYIEKKFYNWENKKILIAEDEDLNFKVLEIALKNTHTQILRANNGHEAIELVLFNPDIKLILMDIQMPLMDGYEALIKIKQINHEIPVIAQTALAMIEEKDSCLRSGFNDYISKPINIPELLMKIDKVIL